MHNDERNSARTFKFSTIVGLVLPVQIHQGTG